MLEQGEGAGGLPGAFGLALLLHHLTRQEDRKVGGVGEERNRKDL